MIGARRTESVAQRFRSTHAVLIVRGNDINTRQQLVFGIRQVNVLILEVQLQLPHFRTVFQCDSDGIALQADIHWPRLPNALAGIQRSQNEPRILLGRDELLHQITRLRLRKGRNHHLFFAIGDFRLGLDKIDRCECADLHLNLIIGKRLLGQIHRSLLHFHIFARKHEIPIRSLRCATRSINCSSN